MGEFEVELPRLGGAEYLGEALPRFEWVLQELAAAFGRLHR
jgi:hypothetical protein